MRGVGGLLYLAGAIVMVFNLIKTAKQGTFANEEDAEAPALIKDANVTGKHWHSWIERRPFQMMIGAIVLVLIGTVLELVPTFLIDSNVPTIASVKPYTPLELEGRDVYIREGCNTCHSQMIRPFRAEVLRYDPQGLEYSKAGEFVYDHPHLWGSKRTGPDLAREGVTNPDAKWHYLHMMDPDEYTSPGSIMPAYPHMHEHDLDVSDINKKIAAMRKLGVPYPEGYENGDAMADLRMQQNKIADALLISGIEADPNKEIIAVIAYLQRLGTDIKVKEEIITEPQTEE
jgi:cytochrome c oxidase cbb3-type subunit I/II